MDKKPAYVIYDPRLGNVAKALYLLLEDAQQFNQTYTRDTLANLLGVTPMTITRGLRELEKCGWIERKYTPGQKNVYTLYQHKDFRKEVVLDGED